MEGFKVRTKLERMKMWKERNLRRRRKKKGYCCETVVWIAILFCDFTEGYGASTHAYCEASRWFSLVLVIWFK